jgi:hypothetical protein
VKFLRRLKLFGEWLFDWCILPHLLAEKRRARAEKKQAARPD